jgi:hypothetical protein
MPTRLLFGLTATPIHDELTTGVVSYRTVAYRFSSGREPLGDYARHDRDQSFSVPVPAGKSFRSRSRSLQKQILVPVELNSIPLQ